jgi:hypothetical protein
MSNPTTSLPEQEANTAVIERPPKSRSEGEGSSQPGRNGPLHFLRLLIGLVWYVLRPPRWQTTATPLALLHFVWPVLYVSIPLWFLYNGIYCALLVLVVTWLLVKVVAWDHEAWKTEKKIYIRSYSPIIFWWPVWVIGFELAWVCYQQDTRLALVPAQTSAVRDRLVEVGETPPGGAPALQRRDVLIVEQGKQLRPSQDRGEADGLDQPQVPINGNHWLGIYYCGTLVWVFFYSNANLRGVWGIVSGLANVIVGLLVLLAYVICALLVDRGWLAPDFNLLVYLFHKISDIPIHVSAATYLTLSIAFLVIWLGALLVARITYMRFSEAQVEVYETIGEGSQVVDVTSMNLEIQRNVHVRHNILGMGCMSDLIFTSSGRRYDWFNVGLGPNRWKLDKIKELLAQKPVTTEEKTAPANA